MVRLEYDEELNVLHVDATGVKPTPRIMDQIFDRLIEMAERAPRKPYALTCWAGVEVDAESGARYGERMKELAPLIVTFVRYAVPEGVSRRIRDELTRHNLGSGRHTFTTRDDALAAILSGKLAL